jgi:predicted DNA-binding transcriptional regulator YafY
MKRGFDLDTYLSTSVDGLQSNEKSQDVKLRFSAESSAAGRDFVWNRNQRTSQDSKGRLVVEFKTSAFFAVERYILSWGGNVEVLLPRSLRARVRATAEMVVEGAR